MADLQSSLIYPRGPFPESSSNRALTTDIHDDPRPARVGPVSEPGGAWGTFAEHSKEFRNVTAVRPDVMKIAAADSVVFGLVFFVEDFLFFFSWRLAQNNSSARPSDAHNGNWTRAP